MAPGIGTPDDGLHACRLDNHHPIEAARVFSVCGNTWRMLADSCFERHFEFIGDFGAHCGIFEGCSTTLSFAEDGGIAALAAGCG